MKLKKLTIHNLASIEDALIDFEHGPLSEDSRFLICGPTGSGKTTLLDAICLVLYGTTPRLNMAKSEGFVDNDEKYGGKQDVRIDDTRMLMRRGSLNAYVELVFADKDDKLLKASWECSRAHNKITGSIKDPVWKLSDASDNEIACKKKEIRSYIEQSIGLTFEQFCRTTMLAQGDFTRFLKSEEGEKSQILEKLTGTDIYSEVSRQIHLIKSEKETICSQIKSRLEGVQLLADEERTEIERRQEELRQTAERLSAEEKKLTAIITWMEQLRKLEQKYQQVTADYEEQHRRMETEEFLNTMSMIEAWERTAFQREEWKKRDEAARTITERKKHDDELNLEYLRLRAGLLYMQNEEQQCIARKHETEAFINSEETRQESYRQINLIESLANQFRQASSQIASAKENINVRNKEIESLMTRKDLQTKKVGKCAEEVEAVTKEFLSLSEELRKMNYEALLAQQKSLIKESAELREYTSLVESYGQIHKILLQKEKELGEIRKDITLYTEDAATIEKEEKNIDEQVARQQEIYDKQKLSCDDMMKEYRRLLSVGDVCPLCGQTISDISSDEHFKSVLQPVKDSLDELIRKQSEVRKLLAVRKAALVQAQKTEQIRQREYDEAVAKDKNALLLKESHVMHSAYKEMENPSGTIEHKLMDVDKCLHDVEERLGEVGGLQKKVAAIQKEKDILEKTQHKESDVLKDMEGRLAVSVNTVSSEQEKIQTLTESMSDIESKMSQYIDVDTYKKEGENYIKTIKVAAEKYQKSEEMLQKADKKLQQMALELKHIDELKCKIEDIHKEWCAASVAESVNIPDISSCWIALHAEVTNNTEIIRQAETAYSEADTALKVYFEDDDAVPCTVLEELSRRMPSEIETLRKNIQRIKDMELASRTEKKTVEQSIKDMNDRRPEIQEGVTYDDMVLCLQGKKNETSELNQQLGQNRQILDNDKANRERFASIMQQLEKAGEEYRQWSELHELFGSADGKKFRNIAQSYVLEQLLVNANQYLHQFTDRYEMICQPGSLTILLRDNDAGGTVRPTTTMSGGESFLLSLSLALGLSSLSRASFSVDTLFIDEGFGTLDSTYLSCVMDALERLHQMGGKRIGIISHVESLKERLTTQIQVSRVSSTLSKVEVVSTI